MAADPRERKHSGAASFASRKKYCVIRVPLAKMESARIKSKKSGRPARRSCCDAKSLLGSVANRVHMGL